MRYLRNERISVRLRVNVILRGIWIVLLWEWIILRGGQDNITAEVGVMDARLGSLVEGVDLGSPVKWGHNNIQTLVVDAWVSVALLGPAHALQPLMVHLEPPEVY